MKSPRYFHAITPRPTLAGFLPVSLGCGLSPKQTKNLFTVRRDTVRKFSHIGLYFNSADNPAVEESSPVRGGVVFPNCGLPVSFTLGSSRQAHLQRGWV